MNPIDTPLGFSSNFLFVPGTRPERFAKALDSGADAVILDLEDAVPEDEKESARSAIRAAWPQFTAEQKKRLVLRSNSPGTKFYAADLILAQELNGFAHFSWGSATAKCGKTHGFIGNFSTTESISWITFWFIDSTI